MHKCFLSHVILLLVLNDVAAAEKAYMAHLQDDNYLKADECALADDLVRAFKTGSEDLLQQTIKKQGFSFLDNQIGRLARKLTLYGGVGAAPSRDNSAPSSRHTSGQMHKNPFGNTGSTGSTPAPLDEYAVPTESMASMTVTSTEDDDRSTACFDFDALELRQQNQPKLHHSQSPSQKSLAFFTPSLADMVNDGN